MTSEPVVILSTAGEEEAPAIAEQLVRRHLAACVNVTGVRSFYRWKGEFCRDNEALMIVKTTRDRADETMAWIRKLHRYELPEMIILPVSGGYPPYLAWLIGETRP